MPCPANSLASSPLLNSRNSLVTMPIGMPPGAAPSTCGSNMPAVKSSRRPIFWLTSDLQLPGLAIGFHDQSVGRRIADHLVLFAVPAKAPAGFPGDIHQMSHRSRVVTGLRIGRGLFPFADVLKEEF